MKHVQSFVAAWERKPAARQRCGKANAHAAKQTAQRCVCKPSGDGAMRWCHPHVEGQYRRQGSRVSVVRKRWAARDARWSMLCKGREHEACSVLSAAVAEGRPEGMRREGVCLRRHVRDRACVPTFQLGAEPHQDLLPPDGLSRTANRLRQHRAAAFGGGTAGRTCHQGPRRRAEACEGVAFAFRLIADWLNPLRSPRTLALPMLGVLD